MAYAQGTNEVVYLGYETTPGVIPATFNVFKIPVINPSWKPAVSKFTSSALTGTAEPRPPVFGKRGTTFTVDVEASKDSLGPLLKCLFGAPVDVGVSPIYDHYYTLGNQITASVEERHVDVSQNFLFGGNYVGSLDMTVAAEGIGKATFGGMGLSTVNEAAATVVNGSITDLTGALPLSMMNGAIKQGGVVLGYVQEISIQVNRNLGKVDHIDGTPNTGAIFSQIAMVGGTMRVTFQDKVLLDLALNSTETSLQLDLYESGTGLGYQFLFPTLVLEPTLPTGSGSGILPISFNWSAYGRGTASDISGEVLGAYFGTGVLAGLNTKVLTVSGDAGANETFTFTVTEEGGLAAVVTKINATAIRVVASVDSGRLKIASLTKGTASSVNVITTTGATQLGMPLGLNSGVSSRSIRVRQTNNRATV